MLLPEIKLFLFLMLYKPGTKMSGIRNHDIIGDTVIVVVDCHVAAIERNVEIVAQLPGKKLMDLQNQNLMPGIISTRVRFAQSLLRSAADVLAFIEWH